MDATHREFVEVVNAILSAPDVEVGPLLDKFAQHAEKHFGEEREWMKTTDFPAADCHIDEHEAVMTSVRLVIGVVAQGDFAEGRRLATELAKWFPGHADYMDAPLAQWMANVVAPIMKGTFATRVSGLRAPGGYECRNVNRAAVGKVSAHAQGLGDGALRLCRGSANLSNGW